MHQLDAQQLVARYGIDNVIATLAPLLTEARVERIEQIVAARLGSLAIAIENLYDPHNGAAAIRSIEAFGLTGLEVVETEHSFRLAPAVTIGCEKWIQLRRHRTMVECATSLRARGFSVYATVPGAAAQSTDIDVAGPVALVFGNEREGLSAEAIAACDGQVALPMYGFTQSFNLSVSVALAVQDLSARRRAHLGRAGDLDDQERAQLRAEWYVHSVKAATQILDRECVKLDTPHVASQTHPSQDH